MWARSGVEVYQGSSSSSPLRSLSRRPAGCWCRTARMPSRSPKGPCVSPFSEVSAARTEAERSRESSQITTTVRPRMAARSTERLRSTDSRTIRLASRMRRPSSSSMTEAVEREAFTQFRSRLDAARGALPDPCSDRYLEARTRPPEAASRALIRLVQSVSGVPRRMAAMEEMAKQRSSGPESSAPARQSGPTASQGAMAGWTSSAPRSPATPSPDRRPSAADRAGSVLSRLEVSRCAKATAAMERSRATAAPRGERWNRK